MLLRRYYWSVVFFVSFVFCEGQLQVAPNSSQTNTSALAIPRYPNCCEFRNQTYNGTVCNYSDTVEQTYTHIYFNSNQTHINDHPENFTLSFYHNSLDQCGAKNIFQVTSEDIVGFIFNGSFIERFEGLIYNPSTYCISKADNINITIFVCEVMETRISTGQVYFPCLIISTLCYLCSAIIYKFVLDVKEVFQKCFIGYCVSMTVTFLFLILLQKINSGCEVLGAIFFLFILSSFVWLFCLCFDMVYSIRTVMRDNKRHVGWERFYLYISGSILIPCIMLFISMISSGSPDVPSSFMKGNGMCDFKDSRITVLFVPIGLLLLLAVGSLIYAFYLIRFNNKKYTQNFIWLEKKSSLKYKTRSCFMIWLPSFIWILDAGVENAVQGNPLVYAIIEGLQGIFVVAVFVLNRYIRKDIYNALFVKNQNLSVSNSKRFDKIIRKFRTESTNSEMCEEINELPTS